MASTLSPQLTSLPLTSTQVSCKDIVKMKGSKIREQPYNTNKNGDTVVASSGKCNDTI